MSCISDAVLSASGGYYASDTPHTLSFGKGRPTKLVGTNLYISVTQLYRVVRDDEPDKGPWRVTIAQYFYALWRDLGGAKSKPQRLISYQWHPQPRARFNYPHLHLGPASGASKQLGNTHIPTGRVALEDVIRYAISQLGVPKLRDDWKDVLKETQEQFETQQTWSGSGIQR